MNYIIYQVDKLYKKNKINIFIITYFNDIRIYCRLEHLKLLVF